MKKALWFTLFLVGCQSNTIGLPCSSTSDCERGQTCYLEGFPGGYCSTGCLETKNCPSGTVCTSASTNANVQFCAPTCTDDGQCRGGEYACRPVTGGSTSACGP